MKTLYTEMFVVTVTMMDEGQPYLFIPGVYSTKEKAMKVGKKLRQAGFAEVVVHPTDVDRMDFEGLEVSCTTFNADTDGN